MKLDEAKKILQDAGMIVEGSDSAELKIQQSKLFTLGQRLEAEGFKIGKMKFEDGNYQLVVLPRNHGATIIYELGIHSFVVYPDNWDWDSKGFHQKDVDHLIAYLRDAAQ